MIGVVLAALLAPTPASAGAMRKVDKAVAAGKATKLVRRVSHRHSYVRALAAQGLASVPSASAPEVGVERLLACVSDASERDWVRSACASTLATWDVAAATPVIAGALGEVGAESRYWLAEALHRLGGSEARAAIAGLSSDPDLFVSTAAREWSR